MTIKLIAGALAAALLASPALASESAVLGAPSEPTIWGHEVVPQRKASLEILDVQLRRPEEPRARSGFVPSEPTVWGHKPDSSR